MPSNLRFFQLLIYCLLLVATNSAKAKTAKNHEGYFKSSSRHTLIFDPEATKNQKSADIVCTVEMAHQDPDLCAKIIKEQDKALAKQATTIKAIKHDSKPETNHIDDYNQLQTQLEESGDIEHIRTYEKYRDFSMSEMATAQIQDYNDFLDLEELFRESSANMAGENTKQETAPPPLPDPFEKTNRQVYVFNQQFEKKIAEPVVKVYDKAVPEPAKESVKNFLSNASLPMSFFNSLFQGDGTNALAAFSHLLINTTVGIGGLFDVAGKKDIKYDKRTFSQTLGHYGVGAGPYLVIPFIGPSSSRDLLGYAADKALDPTSFNVTGAGGAAGSVIGSNYSIAMFMASGVDRRETIIGAVEKIRNQSFDPYSIMKTIYSRNRPAEAKKE